MLRIDEDPTPLATPAVAPTRRRGVARLAAATAAAALLCLPAAALASSPPNVTGTIANSTDLAGATTVAVAGNYAYTTAYAAGQLTAVDISNPAAPTVAGDSGAVAASLLNSSNIAISGGYAYVVSKNRNLRAASGPDPGSNDDGTGNSLTILDIHTDPAHPAIVGTLTDAANLFGAYGIAVSGTFAYVAAQGCLTQQPCPTPGVGDSFSVIDVTDPAHPALVTTLHNASLPAPWAGTDALQHVTSVAISGNFAYVTASYSNRLTVIDISNPAAPSIVASLQDNTNLSFPVDVTVQGGFAYVADQTGNPADPQLAIVSIANPASPTLAGTLANPFLSGAYRIKVSGPFAYLVGFDSSAVSVVDVSNPAAPILDSGLFNNNTFNDTTGLALDATNQHLIVTSPLLRNQQFALYPPFPVPFGAESAGPPETGTVSVLTLDPQPTAVSITASSTPALVTKATTASFQFQASNDVVTTRCKLDTGVFGLCTTPSSQQYSGLAAGAHSFTVEAIDASGTIATASYSWTIGTLPAISGTPLISGTTISGNALLAAAGNWSGTPAPTYAYQWNRCPAGTTGTCTPISGANAATYALSAADVGSTLDVVVTASNGVGATGATSPRTAVIAAPPSPGKVTKLSLAVSHGRYSVHLVLSAAGKVTLTVRRTKPKLGPVLVRITRSLPAGSSTLRVKSFHPKKGATYRVVATAPGGAKRLAWKIRRH